MNKTLILMTLVLFLFAGCTAINNNENHNQKDTTVAVKKMEVEYRVNAFGDYTQIDIFSDKSFVITNEGFNAEKPESCNSGTISDENYNSLFDYIENSGIINAKEVKQKDYGDYILCEGSSYLTVKINNRENTIGSICTGKELTVEDKAVFDLKYKVVDEIIRIIGLSQDPICTQETNNNQPEIKVDDEGVVILNKNSSNNPSDNRLIKFTEGSVVYSNDIEVFTDKSFVKKVNDLTMNESKCNKGKFSDENYNLLISQIENLNIMDAEIKQEDELEIVCEGGSMLILNFNGKENQIKSICVGELTQETNDVYELEDKLMTEVEDAIESTDSKTNC